VTACLHVKAEGASAELLFGPPGLYIYTPSSPSLLHHLPSHHFARTMGEVSEVVRLTKKMNNPHITGHIRVLDCTSTTTVPLRAGEDAEKTYKLQSYTMSQILYMRRLWGSSDLAIANLRNPRTIPAEHASPNHIQHHHQVTISSASIFGFQET
jgi:hypothetical protein